MKRLSPGAPMADRMARHSKAAGNGCVLWTGSLDRHGYGQIKVAGTHKSAHRMAWIAVKGEIPAGLIVCHRCDTPSCVNVEHLFLGTQAENMRDMTAKGRNRSGNKPKLSPEQQARVRADKRDADSVAAAFGISRRTVFRIRRASA